MKPSLGVATLILVAACASACGRAAPLGPPELRLGIDVCDGCGMTIVEPRYAAGALAEDGAERRILKFDDIGCFARFEVKASGPAIQKRWVHDHQTESWIDARTATFTQLAGLMTPMGSGIAAFRDASDADAAVNGRGGETLSWDAILARARDGSLQRVPTIEQGAAR